MSDLTLQIIAYIASFFIVCSFLMKDMLTLRILSILGSILFLFYAYMKQDYPIMFINIFIIGINFIQIYKKEK